MGRSIVVVTASPSQPSRGIYRTQFQDREDNSQRVAVRLADHHEP